MEHPQIVKCPRDGNIRCRCGGQVWVEGKASVFVPYGIGAAGVDGVRYAGWYGQCERCKKPVLAYKSRRAQRKAFKLAGLGGR